MGKGRVLYLTVPERRALLMALQPTRRVVDVDTHELVLYADEAETIEAVRVRVCAGEAEHG